MKNGIVAGIAALFFFVGGCTHNQKTIGQKNQYEAGDETEMLAEVKGLVSNMQLPLKVPKEMLVHSISVTIDEEGSIMAAAELQSPSSTLYISAVPGRAADENLSSSYKITPTSTDTGWAGFETVFRKHSLEYTVTLVNSPENKVTEKQFSQMVESFSDQHETLKNITIDEQQFLSKYQIPGEVKGSFAMDAEVIEPVYSISNEEFHMLLSSDLLTGPVTKKNILDKDFNETKKVLDFAGDLELPNDWFGQTVQLDQIIAMNDPSNNFMLTVTNDKKELIVLEIIESPNVEHIKDLKDAATARETVKVEGKTVDLLSFEDAQMAIFEYDSLHYTITYNGKRQSNDAFVQTIESLTKDNMFVKYLDMDIEAFREGFAIYHDTEDPVSVAVNIYVDNGKFQRNIDISREDYSFTRYLTAME